MSESGGSASALCGLDEHTHDSALIVRTFNSTQWAELLLPLTVKSPTAARHTWNFDDCDD